MTDLRRKGPDLAPLRACLAVAERRPAERAGGTDPPFMSLPTGIAATACD